MGCLIIVSKNSILGLRASFWSCASLLPRGCASRSLPLGVTEEGRHTRCSFRVGASGPGWVRGAPCRKTLNWECRRAEPGRRQPGVPAHCTPGEELLFAICRAPFPQRRRRSLPPCLLSLLLVSCPGNWGPLWWPLGGGGGAIFLMAAGRMGEGQTPRPPPDKNAA